MKVPFSDLRRSRSTTAPCSYPRISALSDFSQWVRPEVGDASSFPRADARRIARFLDQIGHVGRDARAGWSRLAFSGEEREAHRIFAELASELGLVVSVDPIGNSYAEL